MIANIFLAVLCSLLVGLGQTHRYPDRVMSMFDLKPAHVITDHKPSMFGAIYKDCSKTTDKFKLTNVLVEGCSASPCILKKGTEAKVTISFVANEATPNITASVYGEILGVKVPFPLTQPDACQCGVACPTKSGVAYTYTYALPISTEYPSITCPVLWYLYDAEKSEALCMSALVKITS